MTRDGPRGVGAPGRTSGDGPARGRLQAPAAATPRDAGVSVQPGPVSGPVETEAEARELPGVRDVYDAAQRSGRPGATAAEGNHAMLCEALDEAGVDLGRFDHQIALWLANWEPHVIATIASWVTRAGARP
jgi:hypothetical protein